MNAVPLEHVRERGPIRLRSVAGKLTRLASLCSSGWYGAHFSSLPSVELMGERGALGVWVGAVYSNDVRM